MEPTDATPPPPAPARRPRRWIRLALLAVPGVIVLLIGWHGAQVWRANRAVAAELQSYRDAGEPASLADVRMPAVADDHNGALRIQRAIDSLNVSNEQWNAIDTLLRTGSASLEERSAARKAVGDNFLALSRVHEAAALKQTDWHLQFNEFADLSRVNQGFVREIRLADLLAAAAVFDHDGGNDEATADDLRDLVAFANHVDAAPGLLAHLTSISILGRVTLSVQRLGPLLATGRPAEMPPPTTEPGQQYVPPVRPASIASVKHLIDELIDDSSGRMHLADDLKIERIAAAERAKALTDATFVLMSDKTQATPGFVDRWRLRLASPTIQNRALLTMRADTDLAKAAVANDYPAARTLISRTDAPESTGFDLLDNNLKLIGASDGQVLAEFDFAAERRLAATALAVRLWSNDHAGQLPPNLQTLVPHYLQALPADPFTSDGRPLTYSPQAPAHLSSVGRDGHAIEFQLEVRSEK